MQTVPAPPSPQQRYVAPPQTTPKTDGLAVAGMVLGICGLLFGFVYVIPCILAVILSGVAINRINKSMGWRAGKGMAIAGLVCGIIGSSLWLLIFIAASHS